MTDQLTFIDGLGPASAPVILSHHKRLGWFYDVMKSGMCYGFFMLYTTSGPAFLYLRHGLHKRENFILHINPDNDDIEAQAKQQIAVILAAKGH